MPGRKRGCVQNDEVVLVPPELEQAPDKPDRSESSLDGTEPSEPPAEIAAQADAAPIEFGLCRHSQREQTIAADLQDPQWPGSVVRLHLRTGAGDNTRDL